jgi:hypothetical protein
VTRSAFGSSAFIGVLAAATRAAFDSTNRGGFLAVTAADAALRRDGAFDLTLPFLGAELFGFWDFAIERVDMGLGSVGSRRAGIDARTTQSPHIAGRALSASAGEQVNGPTHIAMRTMRRKSSRFCALKSAPTSSVHLAGITTGAPCARH